MRPCKDISQQWIRFVPLCEQAACQRAALMCSIMRVHLWDLTQFSRGKMETTRGALAASHCLMGRLKPVQTEIHPLPRRVGRWRDHRSGTALSTLSSDHIISDLGPSCSPPLCIFTLLSLPWAIKRISHHSLPVCFWVWLWRASSGQRITQNSYFSPHLWQNVFFTWPLLLEEMMCRYQRQLLPFCVWHWICVGFFFLFSDSEATLVMDLETWLRLHSRRSRKKTVGLCSVCAMVRSSVSRNHKNWTDRVTRNCAVHCCIGVKSPKHVIGSHQNVEPGPASGAGEFWIESHRHLHWQPLHLDHKGEGEMLRFCGSTDTFGVKAA